MRCNEAGLALIREFEGLSLKPYFDSAGIPTIGHGHTTGVRMDMGAISEATAEMFLERDVAIAEQGVSRIVRVALNENQFSAMTSFVFNIGAQKLIGTKTLNCLNRGLYAEFADRLLMWTKAGNVELPGLVKRREAERKLFLTPVSA
ncbi:lysozyme [Zavarzinella formosa]|uniref:lysozyme n=1 Tax=Zavarzinella formosa TaxID=360055 RepID=UPI00037B2ADE|nr:lysozyme [Zavarzinella formosa]